MAVLNYHMYIIKKESNPLTYFWFSYVLQEYIELDQISFTSPAKTIVDSI